MATGTSRTAQDVLEKISKYHLECDICRERYNQPKILECLHSFCEHCLEKYYDCKSRGASNIECPSCRRKTILPEKGIPGLKTNFHLISLVDEIKEQEKLAYAGDCEICDEGNEAMHRCLECAQNICSKCKKSHLRVAATSNHTIATLEDVRQGKVEVKKPDDMPKCHKHKGEVQRFYCKTCDKLICRDCTVVDHCKPDHHYVDSGDASVECKQSLKVIFPDFNTDIKELEKSLQNIFVAKQEFTAKVEETKKELLGRAAELVAQVETDKNRMISQLRTLEEQRNTVFDEHEKTVSASLQRKQHSLATAEQMIDTASDGNFLSLYPILISDLKLLQKSPNPGPIDRHKLLYLSFKHDRQDITLGKLQVTPMWEFRREFGTTGDSIAEFNGARGIAVSQDGFLEEILVADCHNKRVVIYNTWGHPEEIIPLQDDVHDVATLPNRFVVVDRSKYVKIFNKDNTLACKFPTVPYEDIYKTEVALTSVAVTKDDTILVGDSKRKVLTEHYSGAGTIKHTIPVQTSPHFLAVKDSDDRVMISGYTHILGTSYKLDCMMDALDRNGDSKFTIKPTINGKPVGHCGGAYWDDSGIYLAVSQGTVGTGHIHQYNAEGRFLSCLAQGLHHPQSITFTPDRELVVADLFSVKIYHQV